MREYSDIVEAASKIDGLDVELALIRVSGMQEVLEAILEQLARTLGERLRNMDSCAARGDLHNLAIYAHGLKSVLANIGATNYSELAAGLEISAKANDLPLSMERFALLTGVMEKLANVLETIFKKGEAGEKQSCGEELLKLKIEEAVACLDNFEAVDALQCLNELDKFTFGVETDIIINEAKDLLAAFKYKKAAALLNKIMSAISDPA